MAEFYKKLRQAYWSFFISIAIIFVLGCISPGAGAHRIPGLLIIGIEALAWGWVSTRELEAP